MSDIRKTLKNTGAVLVSICDHVAGVSDGPFPGSSVQISCANTHDMAHRARGQTEMQVTLF